VSVSVEKELQFKVAVDWLKQKRGDANVAHCWHGSSLSSIEKIVEHGFGTFSNPLNGRYYGDGIYLGANAFVRTSRFSPFLFSVLSFSFFMFSL
jgi:hypothetical protein